MTKKKKLPLWTSGPCIVAKSLWKESAVSILCVVSCLQEAQEVVMRDYASVSRHGKSWEPAWEWTQEDDSTCEEGCGMIAMGTVGVSYWIEKEG